jgi:hypothetical protein
MFFWLAGTPWKAKGVFGIHGWDMDIPEYRVFGWMDKLNLDIHNRKYSD